MFLEVQALASELQGWSSPMLRVRRLAHLH